eukprot:COSAG02_NODE_46315_length_350_cov_0.593625_1_plen_114_part_01
MIVLVKMTLSIMRVGEPSDVQLDTSMLASVLQRCDAVIPISSCCLGWQRPPAQERAILETALATQILVKDLHRCTPVRICPLAIVKTKIRIHLRENGLVRWAVPIIAKLRYQPV